MYTGMSVNADSVLRSVYYKYVHPKEVFIAEGILVPDIARKKNTATLGMLVYVFITYVILAEFMCFT
jgi:isoprenylcysteine carboxyl methyltransferase (ICMT) family protein YpbQ